MTSTLLINTRDAASRLGFSKSTLDKLRLTGDGPAYIKRGKSVYYTEQDLSDWIAEKPRYRSTSENQIQAA